MKQLIAGAVLLVAATTAWATPQYTGNTTSASALNLSNNGYYIWNDASNPNDWFIRWTAPNATTNPVDWFGSVIFSNQKLHSYQTFKFESNGANPDSLQTLDTSSLQLLDWTSHTNNKGGVDGINFTLSSGAELLQYQLGSSLFNNFTLNQADPGVAGTDIYVGEGYAVPKVLVLKNSSGGIYQQFEIPVPEPGALALLGLGLVGLTFAGRRKTSHK